MRADRLLKILLRLQNNEKVTTRELARELDVSERTIHRDMDALSASGIPVLAERGTSGGWRLLETFKSKLTGLKEKELDTLFLAPSLQLLEDLEMDSDWIEARQKLLALQGTAYQPTTDISNRLYIDSRTWRPSSKKAESLQTLHQAVWNQTKLRIEYKRADGTCTKRIIEPLGLVAKSSTWYVVAMEEDTVKTFRVSRIKEATILSTFFERPESFRLPAYWEESTSSFIAKMPSYDVQANVSPDALVRLTFTGRFVQVIHTEDTSADGWTLVTLRFETEKEACGFLLGFGNQVRVASPSCLRILLCDMAQSVIDCYRET